MLKQIFSASYRFIPESVRWLLAKDKNQKAKGIVCKAAKANKVILSENLLESFKEDDALNVTRVVFVLTHDY